MLIFYNIDFMPSPMIFFSGSFCNTWAPSLSSVIVTYNIIHRMVNVEIEISSISENCIYFMVYIDHEVQKYNCS